MSNEIVRLQTQEVVVTTSSEELRALVGRFTESIPNIKTKSREDYAKSLFHFFEWVNRTGRTYSALTQIDIVAYQSDLADRGLAPNSISSYLIALRKFFEWAEGNKIYPNIAKGVKGPQRKKKFQKRALTDRQAQELLTHYTEKSLRDFTIVSMALRMGLRTIEIVRANVGDIDHRGDRLVLKVWGKGKVVGDKEEDFVIISPKMEETLREYLKTRKGAKPEEPLFVTNRGRKRTQIEGSSLSGYEGEKEWERLTTRSVSKICKEGLCAIGLDGHAYTAHSLRHTAGCAVLRHGGSLQDVQFTLRHASVKTSEIYLESIKEEERLNRAPECLLDNAF